MQEVEGNCNENPGAAHVFFTDIVNESLKLVHCNDSLRLESTLHALFHGLFTRCPFSLIPVTPSSKREYPLERPSEAQLVYLLTLSSSFRFGCLSRLSLWLTVLGEKTFASIVHLLPSQTFFEERLSALFHSFPFISISWRIESSPCQDDLHSQTFNWKEW